MFQVHLDYTYQLWSEAKYSDFFPKLLFFLSRSFGSGVHLSSHKSSNRFDLSPRRCHNGEPILFRGCPPVKQTYSRKTQCKDQQL